MTSTEKTKPLPIDVEALTPELDLEITTAAARRSWLTRLIAVITVSYLGLGAWAAMNLRTESAPLSLTTAAATAIAATGALLALYRLRAGWTAHWSEARTERQLTAGTMVVTAFGAQGQIEACSEQELVRAQHVLVDYRLALATVPMGQLPEPGRGSQHPEKHRAHLIAGAQAASDLVAEHIEEIHKEEGR